MEIRILTANEIPQALTLAQGVFDFCLGSSVPDPRLVQGFMEYSAEAKMTDMAAKGEITLWGAFEQGQLAGMSAMQKEGHITMLYVLPAFQRRGLGKSLLTTMRTYAKSRYGYSYVTVNAMPVYTAAYFQKRKFQQMNQVPPGCPFVSMQAKTIEEVSYEKKEIPTGWAIGASVGGLLICTAIAVAFMVSYLHGIV